MPFLTHCYTWSSKYLKSNISYWSKVLLFEIEQLKPQIFHIQMHTYFKKPAVVDRKDFKMQRYSSITLHVSTKTPISEGSKKIISTKIQIQPQNSFLLSDLVLKLLNLFIFKRFATFTINLTKCQLGEQTIAILSVIFALTICLLLQMLKWL